MVVVKVELQFLFYTNEFIFKTKIWFSYATNIFVQYHTFYDCFFKTDHFYSILIKKNILYFVYKLHMQIQLKTKNDIFMLRFQC